MMIDHIWTTRRAESKTSNPERLPFLGNFTVVKSAILFCFTTEVTENTEGIAEGCWEDLNAGVAEVRREKIFLFFPCVPLRTLRSETVLSLCNSVTSVVKTANRHFVSPQTAVSESGYSEG